MMTMPPSQIRWEKENVMLIGLKLMRRTDQDIIDFLQENETKETSKQKIIKEAIRFYRDHREDYEK